MKIYVIEKGCYSDRHVVGVTENEDNAKRVCNAIDADYGIYDTNQFETCSLLRYEVQLFGNYINVEYDDYDIYKDIKENTEYYDDFYIIYATSKDQATKIALDMRAEKQAIKEGII